MLPHRATLGLALSLALATPAGALEPTLCPGGTWQRIGGVGSATPTICGLAAQNGTRQLRLIHPRNAEDFTLEIRDTTWSLAAGTALAVTLQFEGRRPWSDEIAAQADLHGRPEILLSLHTSNLAALMEEFSQASHLHVRFRHAGTPHRWTVALRGTAAAAAWLETCLDRP